jgi:prophage regulatory protein
MKPLPTRTLAPLRMHSAVSAPLNPHAHLPPDLNQETAHTKLAPDRVPPPLKLIRFPVVKERTGLSRWTISRLERRGAFPRHYRISANAVAWVEEEIMRWIQTKIGRVAV